MKKILITMSALAIALTTASASDALTMSPYSCGGCCQPAAPICCPAAPVVEPCCENPTPNCCPANCGCSKCKKHHKLFKKRHHNKACGCQTQPMAQPSCGCGSR